MMAETALDIENDKRKIELTSDMFTVNVHISKFPNLNERARILTYEFVENTHKFLSETINKSFLVDGKNHKIRVFTIEDRERSYVFYQGTISISAIEIKNGSIKINIAFSFAVMASIYTGIAEYPSFKEGYRELNQDIVFSLKKLSEFYHDLDLYFEESGEQENQRLPKPENEITLYIRKEEEILDELIGKLRVASTHYDKN